MRLTHLLHVLLLALFGLLLAAPIASAQRHRAHHATVVAHRHAHGAAIHVAPPAPRVIVRPPIPFIGAFWTDGYWSWNGRSYVWVDGQWVQPVAGRRWSPWRWEQRHGTWVLIPGGWIVIHG
jgi:hypothetical protein